MKKQLCLLAFLTAGLSADAQLSLMKPNVFPEHSDPKVQQFQQHVRHMLQKQYQQQAAGKSTAITQRLIAASAYTAQNEVTDSLHFKYSGTNGSVYDFNYMQYDTEFDLDMSPNNYPYDLSRIDVSSDTMKYWTVNGGTPVLEMQQAVAYIPDGRLDSSFNTEYSTPEYHFKLLHSYDGQGRHVKITALDNDNISNTLDTIAKITIHYDNQNRVIADSMYSYSIGDWTLDGVYTFSYNTAGNIETLNLNVSFGGGWITAISYLHSYYPDHKLKTVKGYQFSGMSLQHVLTDSFSYTGNLPFFTHLKEDYFTAAGTISETIILEKTLNTQLLPDTMRVIYEIGGTSTLLSLSAYQYDTDGNPVKASSYTNNGMPTLDPDGYIKYYYENYNDDLSVPGISEPQQAIAIYPNPAGHSLTVRLPQALASKGQVLLYNMNGQLMEQHHFAQNQQEIPVSVENLAPGTYILRVADGTGNIYAAQTFVKK